MNHHASIKRPPEDWQSHTNFPFEEVFENLDGEHLDDLAALDAAEFAKLSKALRQIIAWTLAVDLRKGAGERVGYRTIALAWVLSPSLFENSPSLRELSRSIGLNQPTTLSTYAAEVRRKFKIKNLPQSTHDWRNQ